MGTQSRLVTLAAIIGICLGVAFYIGNKKKKVWRTGEIAPIVRVKDTATTCYRGTRSITFWYTHEGREYEVRDSIGCRDEIPDPAVAAFMPDDPTEAYLMTSPRLRIRQQGD